MKHSRALRTRNWLLFWTLFIGLGAVAGAAAMLLDPSGKALGMDAMLPYFQVLPFAETVFQDFTFSGWALLLVNGLTNLTAAGLLLRKKPAGVILGGLFGITLMLWICIQFYMFPPNFMSTAYFLFGAVQAATGYAAWVFAKQEAFRVEPKDYKNGGAQTPGGWWCTFPGWTMCGKWPMKPRTAPGAEIYEIMSTECTAGTLGFWWCGRYGMHRWPMPIVPVDRDLMKYDHVTICSPVWVFALAAPVRSFCAQAAGQIREADYILVHHQNGVYRNAAEEMDRLLGLRRTACAASAADRAASRPFMRENKPIAHRSASPVGDFQNRNRPFRSKALRA